MTTNRQEILNKIEAQRNTIRVHIDKYEKFKENGDYTSSATTTIQNCQNTIKSLKNKASFNIDDSYEDSWTP